MQNKRNKKGVPSNVQHVNGLSLYQISDAQHYWFTRYHHQNNKYGMVSKPNCYCTHYTNTTL